MTHNGGTFRCIFKTANLDYKFLHNGHPSYFGPLLSTRCGRYSTRYNRPDKRFLEVPQFCPSVHKSNKGDVVSFHPTTESNLRTALSVEICKLCIIASIWKPFSDFCSEMGICSDVM